MNSDTLSLSPVLPPEEQHRQCVLFVKHVRSAWAAVLDAGVSLDRLPVDTLPDDREVAIDALREADRDTICLRVLCEEEGLSRYYRRLAKVRDHLVMHNLRFVQHMAKKRKYRAWVGRTTEDITSEGTIALIKAINRFDPEQHVRFTTYAHYYVLCQFRAAVLQSPVVTLPESSMRIRANSARGLSTPKVSPYRKKKSVEHQFAWYYPIVNIPETPSRASTVDALLDRVYIDQIVEEAIADLPPAERDMIERRYGRRGEEANLRQIAEIYGLSRERIRQLCARALGRIAARLRAKGFDSGRELLNIELIPEQDEDSGNPETESQHAHT
jgi:RNA polymerase sigma factor (sigma-70 family)